MRRFVCLAALAIGCSAGDKSGSGSGSGDGGVDDTGETSSGAEFADFIDVTEAPIGDFTGFEGGFDEAGGWWTQDVDPDKVGTTELQAIASDFETGEVVIDATVEFWFDDAVSGVADAKSETDSNGETTFSGIPTCQSMTYKVSTDPDLDATKDTYEAHQVYQDEGGLVSDEVNSVSVTTYRLIPSLLGVSVDEDKAVVAGTAFDINEDPIEGAQVVVRDADGLIPESLTVKYFVDEFPQRDQPHTSEDGLWVAMNVPEGTWNIDMYVSDGSDGHLLMSSTVVEVFGGSINISNHYTGYGEGIFFPESCLAE